MRYSPEGGAYTDACKPHRGKSRSRRLEPKWRMGEAQEEEREEGSMSDRSPVSMEADEEAEGEGADNCEGSKSVGRKSPKEPTKVEKEEHERTHCPYRSWCEHCVRARARNGHHKSRAPVEPLEEIKAPGVHLDYFVMSREDEEA